MKMAPTILPLVTLFLAFSVSYLSIGDAETDEKLNGLKLNSHILQESIAKQINENPEAGWEAAINPRFSNFTVGQFKRLLGVKQAPKKELLSTPVVTHPKSLKLPKEFDARTAWSQCSTIGKILDQGHCGSCWAFGAVESLQDRFCIHFDMNISLSVNDLLACCGFLCGAGCDGGTPIYAWRYLAHHGVVTEECDPYFDQIGCSHPGCEPAYQTPKCVRKCVKGNQIWKRSKHYSVKAYRVKSDPQDIMAEVYKNGPVEVAFTVFEDFAHYKSGVYKHITGSALGGHAVKLIGWGTSDEGEDYWLLANQWNTNWGDDGYFKIKRGTNECGIEDDVTAGLPSTKNIFGEAKTYELSEVKLNSHILQESIARQINENPEAGWEATINPRFSNFTVGQFKRLLGVKQTPRSELSSAPVVTHPKSLKLPKDFDARTAWSQCSTIGRILDQGHCGSCWAFGAVESLSDRFCIHFDMNVSLSVNDILACCGLLCGAGCAGGTPFSAWIYLAHHGVVTEECDPYFDQIGCSHPGCEPTYRTPKCVKKCVNGNQLWETPKHYSVKAYTVNSDPQDIMAEVYKNGPVEVAFTAYEDFAHYKSGVYKHITGFALGGHAVKLVGWGTSHEGEDYWLLANQWNTNWGDDGYFKIKRGTNECGIENAVTAGLPSTKNIVREVTDMDVDADVSF